MKSPIFLGEIMIFLLFCIGPPFFSPRQEAEAEAEPEPNPVYCYFASEATGTGPLDLRQQHLEFVWK